MTTQAQSQPTYSWLISFELPENIRLGSTKAALPKNARARISGRFTESEARALLELKTYIESPLHMPDYLARMNESGGRFVTASILADQLEDIAEAYSEQTVKPWISLDWSEIDLATADRLISMLAKCAKNDARGELFDYEGISQHVVDAGLSPESFMKLETVPSLARNLRFCADMLGYSESLPNRSLEREHIRVARRLLDQMENILDSRVQDNSTRTVTQAGE